MRKLEALSPWFFFCLGVVFLGVSILVVPQKAFAQDGGSCSDACCGGCYGAPPPCNTLGSCYTGCYSGCSACVTACDGNQTCIDMCYATWYDQEINCMDDCELATCLLPPCPPGPDLNTGLCNRNTGCGNCKCMPNGAGGCTCYYLP